MAEKKADAIKTDPSLPDVPAAAVKEAKLQGVKDVIAEGAGQQFKSTDGVTPTEEPEPGIVMTADVMHLAHLLELPPEALKGALDGKTPDGKDDPNAVGLTEGQIAGLLETERSGKNRADIVDVLCKRLKIKTPYEVTNAGPNYTNVVSRKVIERG